MNIFFILWYISIIWLDFFYHWGAFSFFHMHISNLKGTFQPQPSPLFQKTEAATPKPLPNSHLTPNFSAVRSQEKICILQFFCWIQKFWNYEFNQAFNNLGTAGWGEGWGRGGGLFRPKEFALTNTLHFWLEKSYPPTLQMVQCDGNIPLSERINHSLPFITSLQPVVGFRLVFFSSKVLWNFLSSLSYSKDRTSMGASILFRVATRNVSICQVFWFLGG